MYYCLRILTFDLITHNNKFVEEFIDLTYSFYLFPEITRATSHRHLSNTSITCGHHGLSKILITLFKKQPYQITYPLFLNLNLGNLK